MIDAHPALKGVSPQAPVADWFVGDDLHHNGALFLPHVVQLPGRSSAGRGPSRRKKFGRPVRPRHARRLRVLPRAGPARRTRDKTYFKGEVAFWNEVMEHGTYDDFWKARNIAPASEEHQAGGDDRRRLVRRREPLRRARDVYRADREAHSAGRHNILVMGPWVHGGWARRRRRHARARARSTPRRPSSTASRSSCRSSSTT